MRVPGTDPRAALTANGPFSPPAALGVPITTMAIDAGQHLARLRYPISRKLHDERTRGELPPNSQAPPATGAHASAAKAQRTTSSSSASAPGGQA